MNSALCCWWLSHAHLPGSKPHRNRGICAIMALFRIGARLDSWFSGEGALGRGLGESQRHEFSLLRGSLALACYFMVHSTPWSLICDFPTAIHPGFDTMTTTLSWCFMYLVAYPEMQKKIQEDLGKSRIFLTVFSEDRGQKSQISSPFSLPCRPHYWQRAEAQTL